MQRWIKKEDGFLSIFFFYKKDNVLNDDFNNNTMDKIFSIGIKIIPISLVIVPMDM